MPNELQSALAEGLTELESFAGESFTFGASTFKAWRVQSFAVVEGKLQSAPDSTNTYEAVRANAPTVLFKRGEYLLDENSVERRVKDVHATDLTTGLFRFTLP